MGEMIYDLRKKIQNIHSELNEIINPVQDIPELITSTNLLRSNEYLTKINQKQSQLLSAYANYSEALEQILATLFDIQNDLKDILKQQSELLTNTESAEISSSTKSTKSTVRSKKKFKK
jgi:DNA repair ATPase RecN